MKNETERPQSESEDASVRYEDVLWLLYLKDKTLTRASISMNIYNAWVRSLMLEKLPALNAKGERQAFSSWKEFSDHVTPLIPLRARMKAQKEEKNDLK